MEDDIQNYLSTVTFRGTPCTYLPVRGLTANNIAVRLSLEISSPGWDTILKM